MKKTIKLEIDIIDPEQKYPNYKFNWRKHEDFLKFIVDSIPQTLNDEFGYTIKVVKE